MVLCVYANSNSRNRKYGVADFIGEAPQREGKVGIPNEKELKITLANGQEYKLRPLNLNTMSAIEEQFGLDFPVLLQSSRMVVYRALLYQMLHDNYPDLTEERVGQLVTADLLESVAAVITEQMSND